MSKDDIDWMVRAEALYKLAQQERQVSEIKSRRAEDARREAVRQNALAAYKWVSIPSLPPGAPPDGVNWRDQLTKGGNGALAQTPYNVRMVLRNHEDFCGYFRWNEITKSVEVIGGPMRQYDASGLEGIITGVTDHLAGAHGLSIQHNDVGRRVVAVARERSYDPVKDYLMGLSWDGTERLKTWLQTYCGAINDGSPEAKYVSNIGLRWMIACAARGIKPGCKCDTMLILESEKQGIGKSTAFDILGGEWFCDTPIDVHNKDSRMLAAQNWIIEMAELQSFKIADFNKMKGFLSQRTDKIRAPYAKSIESFLRHCSFAGTTNQRVYLTDDTGNRRYWSVLVLLIDTEGLERDRDQLFAEAVYLYLAAESCVDCAKARGKGTRKRCDLHRWWLSDAEEEAASVEIQKREEEVPWSLQIHEWWLNMQPPDRPMKFTADDIAQPVLGIESERLNDRMREQIGRAVRKLDFEKKRVTVAGKQHYFYVPTPAMLTVPYCKKEDRIKRLGDPRNWGGAGGNNGAGKKPN